MAFTSVKSIGRAIELIDLKKENLKKAFEHLQSHSSALSSFSLTWPELDSYFTSLQSELLLNFSTLQTQTPKPDKQKELVNSEPVPVPARPELKSLCEKMDGLGLRTFVMDRPKERTAIRVELAEALKHAPDPGSIVLDALEGFWDENSGFGGSRLRTVCVLLLEELMRAGVEIGGEAQDRAMVVASDWKARMGEENGVGDGDEEGKEEDKGLERLGYLQLLASYKLLYDDGGVDLSELIDHVVLSARFRQNVDLCRILGLESKIPDVIQRLIMKGRQLLALKFIFEFELTDEFPPVPLLKDYVLDTKKIAQKVHKGGKSSRQSLNDAAMKEISALKSVIKCIKDHDLESQYSKDELENRIEKLEKEKANRKRPSPAAVPKPQQNQQMKQPKQNGIKRMKTSAGPSSVRRKPPPVPSSVNRAGLLQNHAPQYVNSPVGAYGMTTPSYGGSSADMYGMQRAPVGLSMNLNPATSNPYPSETHAQAQAQPHAQAQPAYYDRPVSYAGYEMPPQYHPVYYPQ